MFAHARASAGCQLNTNTIIIMIFIARVIIIKYVKGEEIKREIKKSSTQLEFVTRCSIHEPKGRYIVVGS